MRTVTAFIWVFLRAGRYSKCRGRNRNLPSTPSATPEEGTETAGVMHPAGEKKPGTTDPTEEDM
jgi:hypothetical protein